MRGVILKPGMWRDSNALTIAGGYTVLALVWIWGSDSVVAALAGSDRELLELLQSVKGTAFVTLTGLFLYVAIAWVNARQRQLASEKRLVEEMLVVSGRLEALGTLAGSIAHDFNNVLTVIRGVAELFKAEDFDRATAPARIAEIDRAAAQANEMVRQLMLFMRDAPVDFSTGDVNRVVREAVPVLTRAAGLGITIDLQLDAQLPHVRFVRAQLERSLLNLVLNARDAMEQMRNRRIRISTELRVLMEYSSLFRPQETTGRFVVLQVSDTGCGIAPEHIVRIFIPFFTTKPAGRGTGLGLTSVLKVVQVHGGWVEVNSQLGRGTTFSLFFPVVSTQDLAQS